MVVLSAAILTKNGRTLVSRQFVEMTRIRIEGLMAAFPKLLGSGTKQHTFIETESVRYVYQPLEQLFVVLITNKASNIVQDLDTLRLLSKVIPDVAGGVAEDKVIDKCFELVFAFDEAITTGGYREQVTLAQIRTNMEMDSHEEKLHQMIQKTKMENAKEESARQAKIMRERAKEQARMDRAGVSGPAAGMSGIGGGGISNDSMNPAPEVQDTFNTPPPVPAEPPRRANPVKGMSLGGLGKKTTMLDSLVAEDNLAPVPARPSASAAGAPPPVPQPAAVYPLSVVVEERLSAKLSREGAVDSVELKGTLQVTATQEAASKSKLMLKVDESGQFTYQPHPKINRAEFDSQRVLILKNTANGFPLERSIGLLRWSMASTDARVPLSINCWPEEEGRGSMSVAIEYSLEKPNMRLMDVAITIPLGTTEPPSIQSIDGNSRHNPRDGTLSWQIDMIDNSNRSGSLEFVIACRDPEAFFPLSVGFTSTELYCNCEVLSIANVEDESPVQYGLTKQLATDDYQVE
mmetsp:Transcript_1543/g.2111  ORF Transcript_1543/g.2111 Transcript_1543/m.2111 type:complete len:519 (+) Transcript_1543:206-1762(+)